MLKIGNIKWKITQICNEEGCYIGEYTEYDNGLNSASITRTIVDKKDIKDIREFIDMIDKMEFDNGND